MAKIVLPKGSGKWLKVRESWGILKWIIEHLATLVCLGLFGRQLVFEILEHLPYLLPDFN